MTKRLTIRVSGERASGKTLVLNGLAKVFKLAGYEQIGEMIGAANTEEAIFEGQPKILADKLINGIVPDAAVEDIIQKIKGAMRNGGLPDGHVIIEQAEVHDGTDMVAQTVTIDATGEEYTRMIHVDEAYA